MVVGGQRATEVGRHSPREFRKEGKRHLRLPTFWATDNKPVRGQNTEPEVISHSSSEDLKLHLSRVELR